MINNSIIVYDKSRGLTKKPFLLNSSYFLIVIIGLIIRGNILFFTLKCLIHTSFGMCLKNINWIHESDENKIKFIGLEGELTKK